MPNGFAYFAILAWPVVVIILFRKLPLATAIAVSIVAGYMLLPVKTGYNLPMLPRYDADLAAALPALIMAMVMSRQASFSVPGRMGPTPPAPHVLHGWLPKATLPRVCLLILLVAPFITSVLNGSSLHYGPKTLPGLGLYDASSATLTAATSLLPFIIARKYLAHPRDHAMLLLVLCLAGLAYSLPTIWEWRMSPQLNRMIYGFAPDWGMSKRWGGFRPAVFIGHGLRLAILMAVCTLAALACSRVQERSRRSKFLLASACLFMALVLCSSLGALLIAIAIAPIILFCGVRVQLLAAACLAGLVLTYPMTRGAGIFPTETVVSGVSKIASQQRVGSLNFRFNNEDILLEKANERPFFGWGGWGRARVYNEEGQDVSVTDGAWVIVFGEGGWVRYVTLFGLLTLPTILLALRRRRYEVTMATSALALVLTAHLLDMLPNAGMSAVLWLMAGAIAGRLEVEKLEEPKAEDAAADAPAQGSPYRRSFPRTAPVRYSRFSKSSATRSEVRGSRSDLRR